ncbi:MAG TPA: recombinase family protein, partial [Rhodanobacter sp.]|nr:recombinase family protein [Rhodanobacter sp.]
MKVVLPCAVYTRKSSEEGLEQGFNSLDAQREACEAFILSQKAQGWTALESTYDDGGFSGGNTVRPGLKRLLADIAAKRVRIVVVYKVDRLTRSLADFAKLVELFDAHGVSFVSVTQQFNTTSSMGRLTLNVLLSFAQFEREVTGERIRDKIAASKRKGLWMGGVAPIGYVPHERTLMIDEPQADRIREIYRLYLEFGCVRQLKGELDRLGWITPARTTRRADAAGGRPFSRGHLYRILSNPIYTGQIVHKEAVFAGQHPAIVDAERWQAVQDRLGANLQGHRTRSTASNPSLLTGLVFDAEGNPLTPTHAKKGARRYRYYVGQPLLESGRDAALEALRLPAQELEDAVMRTLSGFLNDETRLMGVMGTIGAREVR